MAGAQRHLFKCSLLRNEMKSIQLMTVGVNSEKKRNKETVDSRHDLDRVTLDGSLILCVFCFSDIDI